MELLIILLIIKKLGINYFEGFSYIDQTGSMPKIWMLAYNGYNYVLTSFNYETQTFIPLTDFYFILPKIIIDNNYKSLIANSEVGINSLKDVSKNAYDPLDGYILYYNEDNEDWETGNCYAIYYGSSDLEADNVGDALDELTDGLSNKIGPDSNGKINLTNNFSIGTSNTNNGSQSVTLGIENTINSDGYNGVAIGKGNTINTGKHYDVAIGTGLIANGNNQIVLGNFNNYNSKNVIIGCGTDTDHRKNALEIDSDGILIPDKINIGGNTVSGDYGTTAAGGSHTVSNTHGGIALGYKNTLKNGNSVLYYPVGIGAENTVSTNYGIAVGRKNTIGGDSTVALGLGLQNTSTGIQQVLLGKYNVSEPSKKIIIGCGTDDSNRKNAMTIDSMVIQFSQKQ